MSGGAMGRDSAAPAAPDGNAPLIGPLQGITRWAGWGSAFFLTAMMLVTVADVLLRAFRSPLAGAYDLVQLFLVGTVFLSVPDLFLREENIVVDFIDHLAARRVVVLLKVLAQAAGVFFLALLSWQMITPALDALHGGEVSPDLSIPLAVHWLLMIAGIALALLIAAVMLYDSLRRLLSAARSGLSA